MLPDADTDVRKSLLEQAQLNGWSSLHDELQGVDPAAAARIHPNDPQRLQRALEVYRLTGVAMSELQANKNPYLHCHRSSLHWLRTIAPGCMGE